MKKLVALLMILVMALGICAVGSADGRRVGVAMPTESLQRWNQDGANLKAQLEGLGYTVDLQYANNDVALQVSQIENMILNGAEVLIIASIDGGSLDTVLGQAKEAGIPIIAYDRLLTGTTNVDYYTTFDNYGVGTIQGTYVKEALDLDNAEGPFTIEVTAGSPDDNNALLFFQGAYDVVAPYIESGKLIVKSGQTAFEQCATPAWKSETAQARMDNILTANYSDGTRLDVALCSNDSTALGVTNSLISFGLTAEEMPIITGQDCDVPNTKNMIAGLQSMSVFKDTRLLADRTVLIVVDLLEGRTPETNATYANGVMDVPSFNCTPVFADVNNYAELLLDSGYYTAEQLAD